VQCRCESHLFIFDRCFECGYSLELWFKRPFISRS